MIDQYGASMPGGDFVENNAVVAGEATAINALFRGNDYDYLQAGRQSAFNQYETFAGIVPSTGLPLPLYVQELSGQQFGTLAVEKTPTSIVINGIDKSNVGQCGPSVPRGL
jgi:hypothetical protein